MVYYALRHIATQQLLTFSSHSNGDAEFASSTYNSFDLDQENPVWMDSERFVADRVRSSGDQWYNGVQHSYRPEELEVVRVEVVVVP